MEYTAQKLTPEEIEKYRGFFREKQEIERSALKDRYKEAWNIAKKAAEILYHKYGADKVAVFGSLTDPLRFTKWSDIDLAVWGLPDTSYYKAVAELISLSDDFKIDVVDPDECSESLKTAIEKEGQKILPKNI